VKTSEDFRQYDEPHVRAVMAAATNVLHEYRTEEVGDFWGVMMKLKEALYAAEQSKPSICASYLAAGGFCGTCAFCLMCEREWAESRKLKPTDV